MGRSKLIRTEVKRTIPHNILACYIYHVSCKVDNPAMTQMNDGDWPK